MATRIIAVLNQKGGVGKTTTCVNLGAALARRGFRVLLVDMDPQANLTIHLGLEPPRLQRTTYSLLIGQHGLAEAVHETGVPGLLVVPSTLALANAEIQLASTVGRELVLREALEAYLDPTPAGDGVAGVGVRGVGGDGPAVDGLVRDGLGGEEPAQAPRPTADFVIIDCPPSLGTLTMNALCAAGEVLLPIQTEFFALQGVAGILESVRAVQRLNKGLRLSMVVPSLVDRRTTLARDVLEEVRAYFGDAVTRTEIRKNVKLAEAPSHGKTIFEWEPRCNGAADYESLAAEVLGESLDDGTAATAGDAVGDDTGDAAGDAAGDDIVNRGRSQSGDEPAAIEPAAPTDDAKQDKPRSSGISIAAPYADPERAPAPDPPPRPAPDAAPQPAPCAVAERRIDMPAAPPTAAPGDARAEEQSPRPPTQEPATGPPRAAPERASWWRALRRSTLG